MIIIENDVLVVKMSKTGAEVREVNHKQKGHHYMWTGDATYWGRVSPILFPIVGRLKEDQYQINDKTYRLTQHGFLRDVVFDINEESRDAVTFQYVSNGRHLHQYPYEFTARIRYELTQNGLTVTWMIQNDNEDTMFFSIGGHPAFRVPLLAHESAENYTLTLTPAKGMDVVEYELNQGLVVEKEKLQHVEPLQLHAGLFQNDAMIFSHVDRATLQSPLGHGIEVNLTGFPFVGIWSPYDEKNGSIAPFICIEPWYGVADTPHTTGQYADKFGIQTLDEGETFHTSYTISFK
ncbi:aldose 1-epimerase family protein [Bacillus sp. NPDC077027]|uniref:aldose 1-epimerase family protein n=1 Tax=Bacillus sp. NPDC077027 TaxID=3390548 RepID=UPI003CFBD490